MEARAGRTGAARARRDERVERARRGEAGALDAALRFAEEAARGALLGSWKGRALDPAGRDDVRQEVLVRVLRGITASERPVEDLQDWVKGTVALVLREAWRGERRARLDPGAADPAELETDEAGPGERLLDDERAAAVRACVERLPAHYREMLRLRYREGRTNRGVGEAMDKTEKAIEQAVPRALRMVRDCLARKGVAR